MKYWWVWFRWYGSPLWEHFRCDTRAEADGMEEFLWRVSMIEYVQVREGSDG